MDQINYNDLQVRFSPTNDMIADFFKKTLQEAIFCWLHDQIMNTTSTSDSMEVLLGTDRSVLE